jgi:hypothetical protein
MSDRPEWFAPKRYGYGSGWPIGWQGWALTIAYLTLVGALALGLRNRSPVAAAAAIVLPTVAFIVIVARTTRGGWRWRWGEDD